MKSLSKDLRQRYKSVSEIQSDIREFVLLRTKLYSTKKLENPSRRIDKVMKVEQGTVGWEWDGNEYEARDFEIVFRPGFKTPPIVHTSFVLLDTSDAGDHTSRYWVSVRDVSAERAKIKVGTWNKKNYGDVK